MLDMNPEIRAQWCAALRSGEYTQATKALRVRNEDGTYSHCCLGVLTDLYLKAGNSATYRPAIPAEIFHVWEDVVLPGPVATWAGLEVQNPDLDGLDSGGGSDTRRASEWNDDYEADFNKIADMIDGGQQG